MLFLTEKDVLKAIEGRNAYGEAVSVIEEVLRQQSEGSTFHLKRLTMEHPDHPGHLWHNIRILPGMVPDIGAAAVRIYSGYQGTNRSEVICLFNWEDMEMTAIISDYHLHAVRTAAPYGVTTFMEIGSQLRVQEGLLKEVDRLGARAYLGPGFDSGRWVADDKGRLKRALDEAAGWREFEGAVDFIKRVNGSCGDRVRGILIPRESESCTLDLLRATRKAADELKVPISTHAAYNVIEFYELVVEHRMTPVELLESVGLLGPDLTIGHGNLVAENPQMNFSGGRDVELMGEYGVSISHCPVNIARRGRCLDSWERYRKAGVNIALGSDTYPRDFMMQMRTASYFGKVIGHNLRAATAAEVFEAATLGGARALGRDDLGRLAPGARADIIIVDLSGGGTLRYGPVRDPIKSLVECGIGDDVRTVIVDGVVRMEQGRIPGVDLESLRRQAQEAAEYAWDHLKDWDALGRTAEEMSPWSFPLLK